MAEHSLEPRHYVLELAGLPPSANQQLRMHPLARYRACLPYADAVRLLAIGAMAGHEPLHRARVVVTFVMRSRRYVQDQDNLYARTKCLVDALKGIAITDDDPAHLDLLVRQDVGAIAQVRLEMTEVLDDDDKGSTTQD